MPNSNLLANSSSHNYPSNYHSHLRPRQPARRLLDTPKKHLEASWLHRAGRPFPTPLLPLPPTPALLLAMLQVSSHVSDLIFSPGSHPHVEVSGQLVPVKMPGVPVLGPADTQRIAQELIGDNKQAIAALQNQGSCDISYSLPGTARFRVNVFVQRGSHAIVMRVIPKSIPSF